MRTKKLSEILKNIPVRALRQDGDPVITGIEYHAGRIKSGNIYVAQTGRHSDGHSYISQAVSNGAAVIIYSDPSTPIKGDAVYVQLDNPRTALASLAAAFYDYPADEMRTIGITGTNGKSSTVSYCCQLLEALGNKTGYISTVQYKTGDAIRKNVLRASTPDASDLQCILREMADTGCKYAVIEATSHGLAAENNRLGEIRFDSVAMTNVTHEHLEFHGTFEQYIDDKANLFRKLGAADHAYGVVNLDDPNAEAFRKASSRPVKTYSLLNQQADLYAHSIREHASGISFVMDERLDNRKRSHICELSVPGLFNIENIMAALLTVSSAAKVSVADLIPHLPSIVSVKGRLRMLPGKQPFKVIVDYAHSPGSFEILLPMIKKSTAGRLIVLFGSGGERDIEKRPIQGKLAAQFADIVILSDEDPRGEDRLAIIKAIAAGCGPKFIQEHNLFLIPDRQEGIARAVALAQTDDTVLLLGKGHEGTIEYADGDRAWDEEEVVKACLHAAGYGD